MCAKRAIASPNLLAVALPRPAPTVVVPAGYFLMGSTSLEVQNLASNYGYDASWLDGELPQRSVFVAAFEIQVYPVTNRDYALFCAATGYPPRLHWPGGAPTRDMFLHPVTHVNRADAQAYAAWIGMRLPTEAEWEKAARGVDGRTWPWGNVFDPDACQWNRYAATYSPGTARVDAHPTGASPYGVLDLIGNTAEWCADGPAAGTAYIKGGTWLSHEMVNLRPAARNLSGAANNVSAFYGFRCVRSLP
jgi:formylglycine-generating enzyme required for sulfatase activity